MNKEEQGMEIDLMQIIRTLLGNLKYIILVTVLFGVLGYAGSTMLVTPIYEAGAKMIVNTRKDESQNVTNDQINHNQRAHRANSELSSRNDAAAESR